MSRNKRILAASLALLFLSQVVAPTAAWALSSGPSQPEVEGFTPASATNMVDLFTGDMSYNIPLLDVEGYPVNLAYNAGVGMDQEASWVGLGWNLSAGQVERNMRGIPDDFRGDEIVRHMNIRPNRTYGLSLGVGLQVYSVGILGLNAGASLSPSFNNYDGYSLDIGLSMSMRATTKNKGAFTAGLGMTSSSNKGLSMQPKWGYDSKQANIDGKNVGFGLNFGLDIDSRKGLTDMSFGATIETSAEGKHRKRLENGKREEKGKGTGKAWEAKGSSGVGSAYDMGAPTYSPQVGMPMRTRSISFSFTWGAAIYGTHPNITLGAFYSEQMLDGNTRHTPAFGYLNLDEGQGRDDAQLDFNREKDGPYSGDRPALGQAVLTNDYFTVSGQGIGGSYRPFRSDIGHVFDAGNKSDALGGSAGLDLGSGLLAHGGARIMVNSSTSTSGKWEPGSNLAGGKLSYRSFSKNPELERVYFREASEATVDQDPALFNGMDGAQAVRFTLPGNGAYENALGAELTAGSSSHSMPAKNYRSQREPRGQLFSYLNHSSAQHFGVQAPPSTVSGVARPHHISEITVLNGEGARFVYGYPVYNTQQADVEFNVDDNALDGSSRVAYDGTDNSPDNENGKDHYYSRTETPPYAYAWLVSSILSHDYSDVDNVRGPSDGDLGTWTRFAYHEAHPAFEWRTPATTAANKARFIEGLEAKDEDNKGTYVYGKKQVSYLDSIVTKNFYAKFIVSDRSDAQGVYEDGTANGQLLKQLDRIELHVRKAPPGTPAIKTVHFEYDYSLCGNAPNAATAKLTLKKVWFTYGASKRGITAPYEFTYSDVNPAYDADAQDRWGGYKPNDPALPNEDFPYVEQGSDLGPNDPKPDDHAQAWSLKIIRLPSGGVITVDLESDDYSHVQERRATRMFKVVGFTSSSQDTPDMGNLPEYDNLGNSEQFLWIRKPGDLGNLPASVLTAGLQHLYFRFKVKVLNTNDYSGDYISGYADLSGESGIVGNLCYFKVDRIQIDDNNGPDINPVKRAALEFMRVNYALETANAIVPAYDEDQPPAVGHFLAVSGAVAGFVLGIANFLIGPNQEADNALSSNCNQYAIDKSYVKLNDPDYNKEGGGHRVKAVVFDDDWASMEGQEQDRHYTYAQTYTYGDGNGSWGVAAYEPMMGADEIPHRKPVYFKKELKMSPDERFYMEEPYCEALFPSPVVGYSRVVVEDVVPQGLRQTQGTGRVVHEFYTARDFPTIATNTSLDPQRRTNRANLLSLLGFKKIDYMHASQGFSVETNDMHGKPKSTTAYPEGSDEPVSYVRYEYGTAPYGSALRVDNTETVIQPDGIVAQAEIGRDYEFVADTRQFRSEGFSGGADVKFELLYAMVAGIPVPLCLPKLSWEWTRYQTGSLVKKTHRFGRVRKTIKMENGSVVSTENLAYDALTGQVLVTRTANDFKDPIYSMTFPAYWHYDGMGGAYRNIGASIEATVSASSFTHEKASQLFVPGDELALSPKIPGTILPLRAWVDEVNGNTVKLVRRNVAAVAPLEYRMQVIRSGRRNMQSVPMMQVTTLTNPLDGLAGNSYARIVNASAMEFGSKWQIECACTPPGTSQLPLNRWVLNQRGVWRLSKEHAWLTERTRSAINGNSNIRRDGVYASFEPYYEVLNGSWAIDSAGWTTTREITKYNNSGQELENMDALGIYSSAAFGHRGTLVKSVARNASYLEAGFDGFEDPTIPEDCNDKHFRITVPTGALQSDKAHTGRHSARAQVNAPLTYIVNNVPCPEDPCDLAAQLNYNNTNLTITGGATPYTVTPVTLSGSATFTPTAQGLSVMASGNWAFAVTITDASGCTINRTYHAPTN